MDADAPVLPPIEVDPKSWYDRLGMLVTVDGRTCVLTRIECKRRGFSDDEPHYSVALEPVTLALPDADPYRLPAGVAAEELPVSSNATATLAGFLLDRIAEREAAALVCARVYPAPWDMNDRGAVASVKADAPDFREVTRLEQEHVRSGELAWLGDALEHIANCDPARVLAECAAIRGIVKTCRNDTAKYDIVELAEVILRMLAAPYAGDPGHPGHQWRP